MDDPIRVPDPRLEAEELRASRARIAAAAVTERRRIERISTTSSSSTSLRSSSTSSSPGSSPTPTWRRRRPSWTSSVQTRGRHSSRSGLPPPALPARAPRPWAAEPFGRPRRIRGASARGGGRAPRDVTSTRLCTPVASSCSRTWPSMPETGPGRPSALGGRRGGRFEVSDDGSGLRARRLLERRAHARRGHCRRARRRDRRRVAARSRDARRGRVPDDHDRAWVNPARRGT